MVIEQVQPRRLTMAEFEALAALPQVDDRIVEFIGGELVEVPSNPFVSKIAALIITEINLYLREHDLGHVTGEAGGYWVGSDLYAPDVAYISYARAAELASKGYSPDAPELAVEVISDPDSAQEQAVLRRKLAGYLAAGVLVWIVNPYARTVEVYTPGSTSVPVLDDSGTLDGGAVLPGLRITVSDIFPRPRPAPDRESSENTGTEAAE